MLAIIISITRAGRIDKVSKSDHWRWKGSYNCKRLITCLDWCSWSWDGWGVSKVKITTGKDFGVNWLNQGLELGTSHVIGSKSQNRTLVNVAHGTDGDTGSGASRGVDSLSRRFQNHCPEPAWRRHQTQPGHPRLCRPFKVPGVATAPRRHKFSLCLLLFITVSKFRALERWVWSAKGPNRASLTFYFLNGSQFHPPRLRGRAEDPQVKKDKEMLTSQKSLSPVMRTGSVSGVLSEPRVWNSLQWDSCLRCSREGQ